MNAKNRTGDYEGLYSELFERGESLHEANKRRISSGVKALVILPVILLFIRWVTDSDKIVFLIIWILCMFVLCAYLIMIEYLDSSVQNTLEDVTDQEAGFDDLLVKPERIQSGIRDKITEIKASKESARSAEDRQRAKANAAANYARRQAEEAAKKRELEEALAEIGRKMKAKEQAEDSKRPEVSGEDPGKGGEA